MSSSSSEKQPSTAAAGATAGASLARRIRSNGSWNIIGRPLSAVAVFATHMLLTRALPDSEYGEVVTTLAVATLLSHLCPFGLNSLIIRESRFHEAQDDSFFLRHVARLAVVTSIIVFAVFFAARSSGLRIVSHGNAYVICVWAWSMAVCNVAADILRTRDRFAWANIIGGQIGGIGTTLFQLAAVFIAISQGMLTTSGVFAILVTSCLASALVGVALVYGYFLPAPSSGESWRPTTNQLFGETLPIFALDALILGHQHIEVLLVDSYLGSDSAGTFSVVRRTIVMASFPLLILNTTLRPFIAQMHRQGQKTRLTGLVRGSATLALLVAIPIYLVLAVFSEQILSMLFGPGFAAGADALRVLCVSGLFFVSCGCCGMLLVLTGFQRFVLVCTAICMAIYLGITPFLLTTYGIVGAAIAAAIYICVQNFVQVIACRSLAGLWPQVTSNLPSLSRTFSFVCGRT